MTITKDMMIMDIINQDEDIADILMSAGMHCIGCMMAHGETLEQACEVHGISADKLVELINQYEAGKTAPAAE